MQMPTRQTCRGKLITGAPGIPTMTRRLAGGTMVARNGGLRAVQRTRRGRRVARVRPARTPPQPVAATSRTIDSGLVRAWIEHRVAGLGGRAAEV